MHIGASLFQTDALSTGPPNFITIDPDYGNLNLKPYTLRGALTEPDYGNLNLKHSKTL